MMGAQIEITQGEESERLDLVLKKLLRSRNEAHQLIRSGMIEVDGKRATKMGLKVQPGQTVKVLERSTDFGRGANKLRHALSEFEISCEGQLAIDVGASTGGFTQVLLEQRAARVVAIDVGHDQLVSELRSDPRVIVIEGFNARGLGAENVAEWLGEESKADILVADVSFISLGYLIKPFHAVTSEGANLVLLHKPQFEVGRQNIKNGVVKDPLLHISSLATTVKQLQSVGFTVQKIIDSPILGSAGNREFLIHAIHNSQSDQTEWYERIETLVRARGQKET